MEKQYSVAIYPSEAVLTLVKSMKEQLAKEIDWFHSKNSVGHITLFEFKATDKALEMIKKQLNQLCDTLKPIDVHLNGFGTYPNGAFFISPDEDSKNGLKLIMKCFHKSISIQNMQKSNDPHLSIARRLTPEKLEKAKSLFTVINVSFMCESVVLRQFDLTINQFVVMDTFTFNSNPQTELVQGTLF